MLSYLCSICDNLYFVSLLIFIFTGAHTFVTNIMNMVSVTSVYEQNRKQMVVPKVEKVLFVVCLMMSILLPNNLIRSNIINKLQEDLHQQRQQVIEAEEQINTFHLYLQKTNQVEQWTDFYIKVNN